MAYHPASDYMSDDYCYGDHMDISQLGMEGVDDLDSTDYFQIKSRYSSPSPAPRNYPVQQGYVRDYMEEDDDMEEQPQPHHIANPYHDSSQNYGRFVSQRNPHQQGLSSQALRPNQQPYGAYTNSSQSQYRTQAFPQYSQPARSAPPERGSNPRNSHGIPLKPVSTLPDVYRSFFKFGVFNAIQSKCYDSIMNTHDNMVVSAPTGSGKTVLFELALIRLLMGKNSHRVKCVYMAPTKALCSERYRDWTAKLDPMGIKCCELTGDTISFGRNAWGDAKNSSVIITTPEKFDSLSRNWRDHDDILSQTQLFLIDEVHILNESRGSTLEVVASRMKTRGTSVRFVLVSATVPNIDDIATWIENGTSDSPATVFNFGDEFRPCKLTRIVYGYPRKNQNDFSFSRTLDYKLLPLLQKHAADKPVLIFCATRKGVIGTADVLMKGYQTLMEGKQTVPWAHPRRIDATFHDNQLQEFASVGIGVHHAGLTLDDRRVTEDLFLKKVIRIVVATSTLAVGVNLPAHTVVIKGVKMWVNGEWQEYSDLDFIQMIGRAGRPQFDKEGVAVILCDTDQERKYKALVSGQTPLESCLHVNLAEHLNSEIGLSTITDLKTAKNWLHNSFLFQRIQKNPRHYALNKASDETWQDRIDELVESSIGDLRKNELVTDNASDGSFSSTEYGEIMSKYYIRLSTMEQILKLPENCTLRDILEMIANAGEIDLRLRAGEKQIYKKIGDHNDIRFRTKIEKPCDKAFILMQAILGGISLSSPEYKSSDSQPYLEALTVFKHAARIARTIAEVAIVKKSGPMLKHGMELVRSLTAKAWEDRPMVLRQIEQIGEKSIKVLTENGITTIAALRQQKPDRIEALLNRRPPFGKTVLSAAREMPQFNLKITEASVSSFRGKKPVVVELNIECSLDYTTEPKTSAKGRKNKSSFLGMTTVLTLTSDNDFVDFRRIPTKALREQKSFSVSAQLTKPSQTVITRISPDNFAGLTVMETYRSTVAPGEYPTRVTRPASYDVDDVLEGLEDDPNFWNSVELSEDVHRETSSNSTPPQSKCKDNSKSKSTSEKESKAPHDPVKLSNGNYECLHSCKDKKKCRHLCCRDGLPKPPKRPSNPSSSVSQKPHAARNPKTSDASFVHVVRPEDVSKVKSKPKKCTAEDEMKQLDTLHQKSGGLELPAGRRLKLDRDRSALSRKSDKTGWNIELNFTDIEDIAKPEAIVTDAEELPDPRDIISLHPTIRPSAPAQPTVSSKLNEIDSENDLSIPRNHKRHASVSRRSTKVQDEPTTPLPRRRPRAMTSSRPASPSIASKRPRLDAGLVDPRVSKGSHMANSTKPSKSMDIGSVATSPTLSASRTITQSTHSQKNPLFLDEAFSADEGEGADVMMDNYDEPFALDPLTFDFEPTSSLTLTASQNPTTPNATFGTHGTLVQTQEAGEHAKELNNALTENHKDRTQTEDEVDVYAQGLAEFESWLQSGAVEFTDEAD